MSLVKVFLNNGLFFFSYALYSILTVIFIDCLFHCLGGSFVHLVDPWLQLFALSLQFMNEPLGNSSFFPIQGYLVALLGELQIVFPGLFKTLSAEVYSLFRVRVHLEASNLTKKGAPRLVFLGQEAGIKEIVMVYLFSTVSILVLEMVVEFTPKVLLLGVTMVIILKHLDTFVFSLVH